MTKTFSPLAHLSDDELLEEVRRLAGGERQATAQLIASLAELDARRLYLGQGCSSLFTYCTQVLRLSEHAAYGRIEAARAARRFPVVVELLANGSVNLTTVGLLAPHLTPQNHLALLDSACHKSKRDVELMVACLRPQPPVPSTVRKLPSPRARGRPPWPGRCPERRGAVSGAVPRASTASSSICRPTRAGSVQGSVHGVARHVRETAPGAGPPAAHDSERRPGCNLRSGTDAASGGSGKDETRGR